MRFALRNKDPKKAAGKSLTLALARLKEPMRLRV
jgi:hypothetical protein